MSKGPVDSTARRVYSGRRSLHGGVTRHMKHLAAVSKQLIPIDPGAIGGPSSKDSELGFWDWWVITMQMLIYWVQFTG